MACPNRVTGLIGTLMASNRILRASPGRESQAKGLVWSQGVAKEPKCPGIWVGSGGILEVFPDFSRNGPEWLGKAWGVLFGCPGEQKTQRYPSCGPENPIVSNVAGTAWASSLKPRH